jgi:hypothetical protein
MRKNLLKDLGLLTCRPFLADRQFILALLAGVVVWLGFWLVVPGWLPSLGFHANFLIFLSLVLWQPVLEELLFRGIIQGQFLARAWGGKMRWGLTHANLLTSVLFVLAHTLYHPPLWAFAVFVPSLVFGHFRDRYGSIYPALLLHVFYNAGYFLLGAIRAG